MNAVREGGATARAGERPLVLLVEDDPALQHAMGKHLRANGFDVVSAVDLQTARACLAHRTPRVACIDAKLPRESGYEVCELLRKEPSLGALRIVFLGDSAWPEARAHALEAGADAFLVKPVRLDELTRQIRELLGAAPAGG